MKILITGATGLVGTRLVRALRDRGDTVAVLSRDPLAAQHSLGAEAHAWNPADDPAPADALAAADAVVHLAGAPVDQKWTAKGKHDIRASREEGTRHLVAGIEALAPEDRPSVLVSASAVGYYGPHGDERVPESTPPADDFLGAVCVRWEEEATRAEELGLRVVRLRTGVVLDTDGGALKTMLTPFRLGVGGPVAGGRQYIPWIHADDLVGLYLAALDRDDWTGPYNATAPNPVTNREFSKALGTALHRPAVSPIPAFAIRALYGEMAQLVTQGQRATPDRPLEAGFAFAHPDVQEALESTLAG